MKTQSPPLSCLTIVLAMGLNVVSAPSIAGEDVKVLLELLLGKGIITQDEYDSKIKKAQEIEELKQFHEAQDIRRATASIEKKSGRRKKIQNPVLRTSIGRLLLGIEHEKQFN